MACETLFRFSLALTVGSDADIERTRLCNHLIIILITTPFFFRRWSQKLYKRKLDNIYLRPPKSQERLISISRLFIGNTIAQNLDSSERVKNFVDF
jgi:hypothetical protein